VAENPAQVSAPVGRNARAGGDHDFRYCELVEDSAWARRIQRGMIYIDAGACHFIAG
jgi:hypothetical protein